MNPLSALSRTDLARALVAPFHPSIADSANPALPTSSDVLPYAPSDAEVSHKLAVARELWLRQLAADMRSGPIMDCPGAVCDWLRLRYARLEHEMFLVLHLDVRHRLIDAEEMSRGTLTYANVYPREVVKSALAHNSAAMVLAHNHPSGEPQPSQQDILLTQRLQTALALVDVHVVDHFVVAGDKILSFAERGLL